METGKILTILVLALGLIFCSAKVSEAGPIGTAITYQGRLIDANSTADGLYDFAFKLFDDSNDPCSGNQLGSDVNKPDVDVIDGYFTVEVDFGDVYDGNERWLEIGVRPGEMNDPNGYMPLSPRQEVTATPYALYAAIAGSDSDWMVSGNDMYSIPSGNVGIGTTSPVDLLEVASDSLAAVTLSTYSSAGADNPSELALRRARGTMAVPSAILSGDVIGWIFGDGYGSTTWPDIGPGINFVATENWTDTALGSHIGFYTIRNGTNVEVEAMRIDQSGNVGIGNANPAVKLDVDGDVRLRSNDFWKTLTVAGKSSSLLELNPWNFGLAARLHVEGPSSLAYVGTTSGHPFRIRSNNLDRIFVDTGGNVGIGTTGPGDKLNVAGHINSSESYKLDEYTVLSNTGTDNILVGKDAGANITTGNYNSAMGTQALYSNTTGGSNSAMGTQALYSNTTGGYNSALGYYALKSNTFGWYNSALGYYALKSNSTGFYNSAMGYYALMSNTTGYSNSAMGYYALNSNTTGKRNSAMGSQALYFNTTGEYNSAMGYYALRSNTTGSYNSAVGYQADYWNQEGSRNTIIGYEAGRGTSLHNKSGNVFLGYQAGYNETGDNKLYIANSDTSTPLIYGDFATSRVGIARVAATNAFEVEGDASKNVAGDWLANSDARIKADVQTITNALERLDKVRLVSFKYNDDYRQRHSSIEDRRYMNVVAQEFREVFPEYVKSSGEKLANGEEILQVDAYPLTVYSAAAVQELHAIVKEKDAEIAELKARLAKLEALVDKLVISQEGGQK